MRKDNVSNQLTTLQKDSMVYDRKGFDSRKKGFRQNGEESPALTQKMGTGGNNVPMVARALRERDHKDAPSPEYHYNKAEFNLINQGKLRRLIPIECERLQGFPDNWTEGVSDTQRYKMMGNAVTVNVIEAITRSWFR